MLTTFKTEIAKTSKSVTYTELCKMDNYSLKFVIHSNAYAFQSNASVFVLQDNQWSKLDDIHFTLMKTPHELTDYHKNITTATFAADKQELLRVATILLTNI